MRVLITILTGMLLLGSAAAVSAETTVDWWQFWTDPAIKPTVQTMVQEFEAANPDIKVNLTDLTWSNGHEKIAIAFASGSGPDVVELGSDWIAQFAANDQIEDVTERVSSDRGEFDGWGMATYNDRVYARPWILGTRVLYVNRDLLKQAGFADDFLPVGWRQLFTVCHKVNGLSGKYGWGSNTAEKHRLYKKFLPFFWSKGAEFFTEDGEYCVVSSTDAVHSLQFYKHLHDSCSFVGTQRAIEDAFLDGKIGCILSGDWLLKRIELEKRDINFTTTLMPGPESQTGSVFPGRSFMGGEFLAVNAASKQKDAAYKFVSFITSPENQLRFCKANRSANPSSRAAQKDPYFESNPYLQTFIRQLRLSIHPPVDPDWVFIEEEIERAVEDALFGTRLVAEPLRQAQINITNLKKRE